MYLIFRLISSASWGRTNRMISGRPDRALPTSPRAWDRSETWLARCSMSQKKKTHSNNVLTIAQYFFWIMVHFSRQVNINADILFIRIHLRMPNKNRQKEDEDCQTHTYLNFLGNSAALRQSFPTYDYLFEGQSIPQPICQFWLDSRIACGQSSNSHEKASRPGNDVYE